MQESAAGWRRTLLQEVLDLIRVEILHRDVVLWLGLSRCSRRRTRSFGLLRPPCVPRKRRHGLLLASILFGGGVRARVLV
jgi:hypothetical protein